LALAHTEIVDLRLESSSCSINVPQDSRLSAIVDRYISFRDILAAGFKRKCVLGLEVAQLEGTINYSE